MVRTVFESSTVRILKRMVWNGVLVGPSARLVVPTHQKVGDDAMFADLILVNASSGRAHGLDGEVRSAKDGGDRQLTAEAAIAEVILEGADRHVGQFSDGVIH